MTQTPPPGISNPDPDQLRQETLERIRSLEARANRGLWILAAFLAVSIIFSPGFDLLPALSAATRNRLGAAPPVLLIQLALVIYAFSAAVRILSRMARGKPPRKDFSHLLYLTAFFGFFYYAQAVKDNFWAVLVAGGTILGLAAYNRWTYCSSQVREEQEVLQELERRRNSEQARL